MAQRNTRDALLEQGALLFARHGVNGVTTRQLHEAIGARNESAVHYYFGNRDSLVQEILERHLRTIEARRAPLVAAIVAEERDSDLRALVHALAQPMAGSLTDRLGRAHLRLMARLDHPALAYEHPFRIIDAPAGRAVARWLRSALEWLPGPVRRERLAVLRSQLVGQFGERARLVDEQPDRYAGGTRLFLENLLDVLVAGLSVEPSDGAVSAAADPSPDSDDEDDEQVTTARPPASSASGS